MTACAAGSPGVIDCAGLDALLAALRRRGYTVIGPSVRSRSIVFGELESVRDLPAGWVDRQEGGAFRLEREDGGALFAHTVGHDSLKRFLFPPVVRVWRMRRDGAGGLEADAAPPPPRYAFVGVRACDLRAVAILDRVLLGDRYVEPDYQARRRDAFFVAVNCGRAGGTCFCASMGSGPKARDHDLALTELLDADGHRFLVEVGSERGAAVLADVPCRPASAAERDAARAILERTATSMGRALDTAEISDLLHANAEHPRWDAVAERCLSCGNCTLVCPTCFCSSVEDTTDLAGGEAQRTRVWDSCFTLDHSFIHGGSLRRTPRALPAMADA